MKNGESKNLKLANKVQFSAWLSIFLYACYYFYLRLDKQAVKVDLFDVRNLLIVLTKWTQLLQFSDFFAKGSLLPKVLQYIGRMGISWLILPQVEDLDSPVILILMWSFADLIRYLFYLKPGPTTGILRYNIFLVLYPAGLLMEFVNMWDVFWNKWKPSISFKYSLELVVACQVVMFLGLIVCYSGLWKQRKVFYSKLKIE